MSKTEKSFIISILVLILISNLFIYLKLAEIRKVEIDVYPDRVCVDGKVMFEKEER